MAKDEDYGKSKDWYNWDKEDGVDNDGMHGRMRTKTKAQ